MSNAVTKYLKDYQKPLYTIEKTELKFELGTSVTVVEAALTVKRCGSHNEPLILDGQNMRLIDVIIDGEHLMCDAYEQTKSNLIIKEVPEQFVLNTVVEINPAANKSLTGLYKSNSIYCTQCESHGFRNITYHMDRPDVLSVFSVKITADVDECPILLSNGNKIDEGKLPAGRHWVKWHDPHPKPTYLFAMVAGELERVSDTFTTCSGREVTLEIFVNHGKSQRALFALACLKKAMRWDEETFNREYDLDIYMIVAVNDFNFGAMENKGLNIFNDKYILASGDCATDEDFLAVDVVVAHEYFHNWSGNRVTCRDWFQLSLKEGLTVFREQKYTEDIASRQLERLKQAKIIETFQFKEDAGPMSHAIRPNSYIDMNNFYTVTVYNKGSEVIRMLETMTSAKQFVKGTDKYFKKFDGQAVTTDDFIDVMQTALKQDLTQFRLWYDQAGTPEVTVALAQVDKQYNLEFSQKHYPTHGQKIKANLLIPIRFNIHNKQGQPVKIPEFAEYQTETGYLFNLSTATEKLVFASSESELYVSALEQFSAPVLVQDQLSLCQRLQLAANTKDGYQKYKQLQKAHLECIDLWLASADVKKFSNLSDMVVNTHELILLDQELEPALKSEILRLPTESLIMELRQDIDIDKLILVMRHFKAQLATRLADVYQKVYSSTEVDIPYHYNAAEAGKRSLRNYCLAMLNIIEEPKYIALATQQFKVADNMTDKIHALFALATNAGSEFTACMDEFYQAWEKEPLVVDKWLVIQASSTKPDTLNHVKSLLEHDAYDATNPNRVRALIGAFCQNFAEFHRADGESYKFLTSQVLKIQEFNPQLAARIVAPLLYWRRFDQGRQELMRACLEKIAETSGIAPGVLEPVARALDLELTKS